MGEISRTIRSLADVRGSIGWAEQNINKGLAGGSVVITLGRVARSLSQNKKMWPMLADISRQCELCIDGAMVKAEAEDWKDVFTASINHQVRVAKGFDGGVVFLGLRTKTLSKERFSELIELIYAYGAQHEVKWSEPALKAYEQYGGAA